MTEKFYHLKNIIVPVVFRRSDYKHLPIPQNAFISLEDFELVFYCFEILIGKIIHFNKESYKF